jgi:DNA-binding XRE family transcriptional regulator
LFNEAVYWLCLLAGDNRAAVEGVATVIRSELEATWLALTHAFYGRGEREPDLTFDEPACVVRFCDDAQPSGRYPRRARWLQSIMEAAGLSQAALARLAGVDRKAVRAILRGGQVHKVTIERIIKALKQLPGFERLTEAAVPDE